MKKILILTTGFGEGENVAARNVREALEMAATVEVQVEVLDLLDSCYGRFRDLLQQAFQTRVGRPPKKWRGFYQLLGSSLGVDEHLEGLPRLRHTLRDALRGLEPDVVVATSPLYSLLITELYRDGQSRDFTLVSLVTDPPGEDSPWARTSSDFFAVIDEPAARELVEAGVAAEKLKVFGFPVQTASGEKRIERPDLARGARPRILHVASGSEKKVGKLLDRLLAEAGWDITVCVGDDTPVEEIAREKAATAPGRIEVIAHTNKLPQLLRTHHLAIGPAETGLVHETIAAQCPLIMYPEDSADEENVRLLRQANAGVLAEKPRDVVDWIGRALRDEARLLLLWQKNLEPLSRPDAVRELARFLLIEAEAISLPPANLLTLPGPVGQLRNGHRRRLPKKILLCDLHTHTTWSDGKLTVAEMVDFYGQRGFDCLCITDHLCDPMRLLGRIVNLTGLVIPPGEIEAYFADIEKQKKRAWEKYELLLMTGIEFNKDGYTPKTSTHLLGVDLRQPIDPSLDLKSLIAQIQAQGGLAIASHPHEIKSEWGKNTLYLWENVDEYAPLLDAWEVANRNDIFNPVGLKKLPFIASSDFHKPKHIHSWKTVLYCEKEAEAIKHCIRVNRDVSLTLYRDQRFGLDDRRGDLPGDVEKKEIVAFPPAARVGTEG